MILDDIEPDSLVFLDAPIFIYHFTGASAECRRLLERCERGDLRGITSVVVVAEVAHRLMTIEAVAKGLVSAGNVVKKLREKPEIVSSLRSYQDQVEKIPLMSIEVAPLELGLLLRSAHLRQLFGLLVNDSLAAATAIERNVAVIASADQASRSRSWSLRYRDPLTWVISTAHTCATTTSVGARSRAVTSACRRFSGSRAAKLSSRITRSEPWRSARAR